MCIKYTKTFNNQFITHLAKFMKIWNFFGWQARKCGFRQYKLMTKSAFFSYETIKHTKFYKPAIESCIQL